MPRPAPHDPHAEQKVRDGVGGHGVTQAVFADHQALISERAKNSGEPLMVREPEYHGGNEEWQPCKMVQRDALKIRLGQNDR